MKQMKIVLLIVLCMLVLAACGGSESESSDPEVTPTERNLASFDFEEVCKQGTVPRAPDYSGESGVHPLIVMHRYDIDKNNWSNISESTLDFPVPWTPYNVDNSWDYSTVELVACIERVAEEFAETCEYEDDESDDVYLLNVHNATYDITIYVAQTGELLGSEQISAEADGCPFIHFFDDQEEDDFETPWSLVALQETLQPYVEPVP